MATQKKEPVRVMVEGRMINGSLFEKDTFVDDRGREGTPSYKIELAVDPKDIEEFEDAVVDVACDEWGDNAEKDYDDGKINSPITDGDEIAERREKKGKPGDAYQGMMIVRASTIFNRNGEDAPGGVYVCDENAEPIDFAERSKFYNGCYVRASLTLSAYPGVGNGKDGVKAYLNGVQFVKDGERLRSADPSSLFSPMRGEGSESKGRRSRRK